MKDEKKEETKEKIFQVKKPVKKERVINMVVCPKCQATIDSRGLGGHMRLKHKINGYTLDDLREAVNLAKSRPSEVLLQKGKRERKEKKEKKEKSKQRGFWPLDFE